MQVSILSLSALSATTILEPLSTRLPLSSAVFKAGASAGLPQPQPRSLLAHNGAPSPAAPGLVRNCPEISAALSKELWQTGYASSQESNFARIAS
jgi:hypothetical protein